MTLETLMSKINNFIPTYKAADGSSKKQLLMSFLFTLALNDN